MPCRAPGLNAPYASTASVNRGFCAIRGYVSTLRKNQRGILTGLRLLFEGHPWLPGET